MLLRRAVGLGVLGLSVLSWSVAAQSVVGTIPLGSGESYQRVAVNAITGTIYVAGHTVTGAPVIKAIDGATHQLLGSVETLVWPTALAVNDVTGQVVVAGYNADGGITESALVVVDAAATSVIARVPLHLDVRSVDVSVNHNRIYVAAYKIGGNPNWPGVVAVIDGATHQQIAELTSPVYRFIDTPYDPAPQSLIVEGDIIFVAGFSSTPVIARIDAGTHEELVPFPVTNFPWAFAVAAADNRVYTAGRALNDDIQVFETIDATTGAQLSYFVTDNFTQTMGANPLTDRVYLHGWHAMQGQPRFSVIDSNAQALLTDLAIDYPYTMALDRGGNRAYLLRQYGSELTVVDLDEGADTLPPVINAPAALTVEATGYAGANATYSATARDNVDASVAVSCSPASGSFFAMGTTPVLCNATDTAGNTATHTFNVVVADTTAPELFLPSNFTVEANNPNGTLVDFSVNAVDVVDGGVAVNCAPSPGSLFPLGTTTVNCSAVDSAGNAAEGSFTVTSADTTPPVLLIQDSITQEAYQPGGAWIFWWIEANDVIDGSVPWTCSAENGNYFPVGVHTVTCEATDLSQNTATGTITITITDTNPPALSLPPAIVTEATGAAGAVVTFEVTAYDFVSEFTPINCAPESGSTFAVGVTDVNCSSTDAANNTGSGGFTVTVRDTTAPIVTVPGPITAEASGPTGANVTFTATATDVVSGATPVTCVPASGSTFALGSSLVVCESADAAGNTGSASFTVSVSDTIAPEIAVSSPPFTEATSAAGATVTFAVNATDAVSGGAPVTCAPASGSTFPIGTTTVNCQSTDGAGNTGSASFSVTVGDTTAPAITVPSPIVAEATSAAGAVVTFSVGANDAVSGATAVTCSPAPGSTFAFGSTTVNCQSTDSAGNTGAASFTVTVGDTTAPAVTVPSPITVEAASGGGTSVTFSASASDAVSGSTSVTCAPTPGSTFPLGTTTVNCQSTDGAGNTGTASFTVTVQDTTPPTLTLPVTAVAEAASAAGAAVTFSTSATDAVSGNTTVTCSPASGSTFGLGATTVDCSSVDAAGNTASGSFLVIVIDTTAPVITSLTSSPANLWPANGQMVNVTLSVTATDAVTTAPACQIANVTSNQPVTGSPDWNITGGLTLQLRAEREGGTRIYTITVVCFDLASNSTPQSTTVAVAKP